MHWIHASEIRKYYLFNCEYYSQTPCLIGLIRYFRWYKENIGKLVELKIIFKNKF